jgi:hypothetical protein
MSKTSLKNRVADRFPFGQFIILPYSTVNYSAFTQDRSQHSIAVNAASMDQQDDASGWSQTSQSFKAFKSA